MGQFSPVTPFLWSVCCLCLSSTVFGESWTKSGWLWNLKASPSLAFPTEDHTRVDCILCYHRLIRNTWHFKFRGLQENVYPATIACEMVPLKLYENNWHMKICDTCSSKGKQVGVLFIHRKKMKNKKIFDNIHSHLALLGAKTSYHVSQAKRSTFKEVPWKVS